ncbi:MAG: iron ABC transporter permease [Defluviitaleaceae bacterium]|nr:iron ABC transporter permease [Defluviitaleaceae bacterium]
MRTKIILSVGIVLLVLILAVGIGSIFIPPLDILRILGNSIFGFGLPEHITDNTAAILRDIRLPRVLLAFFVGAGLSASGAVMQSVLRNPLASSYTLGVASGASLGASLVIFLGVSLPFLAMFTLPVLGFTFGLGTIFLVIALSSKIDMGMNNYTIILMGMVFSLFVNAITTLMFALFREGTQRMVFWQMGSFLGHGWQVVAIIAPIAVLVIVLIMRHTMEMDVLTFGEEQANTVGINAKRVKTWLLVYGAALTGVSIAFVGTIGFVDLVAPHVVRKLYGASHKIVIPMSALFGGSFMVIADLIARTIMAPAELPVGVITAIIGAPFFAYIYFAKRKRG